MARYFLNIDPNDENFQQVTELEMIDNSEEPLLMFYFKNGTKCSKEFIAEVNTFDAFGKKAYIELTSPRNCWKYKESKITEQVKYGTNADGVRVELVDTYLLDHPELVGKSKWNCTRKPNEIPGFIHEPDNNYFLIKDAPPVNNKLEGNVDDASKNNSAASNEEPSFDFNVNIDETPFANKNKRQSTKDAEEAVISNTFNIDSFDLLATNKTIIFDYNGKHYQMEAKEFFKNAIAKPEEKIVEKIVEKVVEKEVIINKPSAEDHLNINIDDNQKQLINNMIDMSQKDKCDIDMEITLSLPPVEVYKLIKTVYPEGMASAFVNIIADRMQILELKSAVASGLIAYYDESAAIPVENENKQN